jgi:hypothetical protein
MQMVLPETFIKDFHLFVYETTRFVSPFVIATEWVFVGLLTLLIVAAPLQLRRVGEDVADAFKCLARHRFLAVLISGLFPVTLRLVLFRVQGAPKPSIHDEFSHLLLMDTLVTGRLTNPTHPMWRHFETIHVIQKPTYNSMYLPGQAIFLALGQWLFHNPWFGVIISVGLMCMAICWMMQAWLPPQWALYGSMLAALKLGVVGFWMNSYMGGAPAAIGGALVFGAFPRLLTRVTRAPAILLAIGLLLLMNTRPLEGGLLAAFTLAVLAYRLVPRLRQSWRTVVVAVLPAAALFLCGSLFTTYYCYRVTGSPVTMPYVVNRATYGWPENLAILPPKQLQLEQPVLQAMYQKELANRNRYASVGAAIDSWITRFFDSWVFFVGPALSVPFVLLPFALKGRDYALLLWLMGLEALINVFQLLLYPQHLAHVTGVIFTLLTVGFWFLYRTVAQISPVRAKYMAIAVPLCLCLVGAMKMEAEAMDVPVSYWERAYEIHRDARFAIQQSMEKLPDKQLIILNYGPDHSPDQEWLYNKADVDKSQVVWARDMGPSENRELVNYFPNRHVWWLEVDKFPPLPVPYANQ